MEKQGTCKNKWVTKGDGNSKKVSKWNVAIKTTVTEMSNAFDRLLSGLTMTKEIIREFEDMLIEISQTEKWREKKKEWRRTNKDKTISKNYETIKNV